MVPPIAKGHYTTVIAQTLSVKHNYWHAALVTGTTRNCFYYLLTLTRF